MEVHAMVWFFNAIYLLTLMFASPWLVIRAVRSGRYREGWREKLLGLVPRVSDQPTIWLHGVSVGEVQLLKPIADRLSASFPNYRLVISTTTGTGMKLARSLFANHTVCYFPLDFSWAVKRALALIQPSMIVLGELEVWPNLVALAHRQEIPVVVINGRLSEKSFRGYLRAAWLLRPTFSKLALILAQNATYAARFRELGGPCPRICVTGSTKFDNVTLDRNDHNVEQLRQLIGVGNRFRIIVAGSTQDPEEAFILAAFQQLAHRFPELRLVVVPRHAERFEQVYHLLRESKLSVIRRNQIQKPIAAEAWQVLLVDTIGELRYWWGLAEVAIVGGSFGTRGGQNMIEPAGYGANVAFGPNTWNFRDVVKALTEHEAVTVLADLSEIDGWLNHQLDFPEPGRERGSRARQTILEHQGATDRTVGFLGELLAGASTCSARSAA